LIVLKVLCASNIALFVHGFKTPGHRLNRSQVGEESRKILGDEEGCADRAMHKSQAMERVSHCRGPAQVVGERNGASIKRYPEAS
jgi:hypothetical protein